MFTIIGLILSVPVSALFVREMFRAVRRADERAAEQRAKDVEAAEREFLN